MIKSKKILSILTAMTVMIALFVGTSNVFATNPGAYTTSVKGHYAHPTTGKIEDSGGPSKKAMGQGMVDSTTYGQGLIEVDASGKMYATVRLNMRESIGTPSFSINGAAVPAKEVQRNAIPDSGDFRFPIPSLNSVVRTTFKVIPMERVVIYYITFAGMNPGNSNFVVNVKTETKEAKVDEKQDNSKNDKLKESKNKALENSKTIFEKANKKIEKNMKSIEASDLDKKEKSAKKESLTKISNELKDLQKKTETLINSSKDEAKVKEAINGLQEKVNKLTEKSDKIAKIEDKKDKVKDKKEEKKDGSSMLYWIIGIVALVVIIGGIFAITKKNKAGKK